MNLDSKGWLKKYLDARAHVENDPFKASLENEVGLYQLVQPTGLLYGHPVRLPNSEQEFFKSIMVQDKMRVIMAESFIHGMLQKQSVGSKAEMKDLLENTSVQLVEFYNGVYPRFSKTGFFSSNKNRSPFEQAEIYLGRRITIKGGLTRNFWSSFFHNSLLFLDVFYFNNWITKEQLSLEKIPQLKENMRMAILKIIASAAFSDGIIEKEERKLFGYFLKSADLPKERLQEAKQFLREQITLEEINFSEFDESWLLKKYILELAILTIWSDRIVTEEEKSYLIKLSGKLGFSENDLEGSMMALETFVLEHWQQVHYLRNKRNYSMVSELVINRLTFFVTQNKERVVQEIHESKELMNLLSKSRKEQLTPEEKEKVRIQIIDILKLIPAFLIIALPFTFITLPILIKILPKKAFPSAFQD